MRVLLATLLLVPTLVGAQPLLVTGSSPTDYAASVPTETTVSFTFSEPLADIEQGFGSAPVLVTLPTGAVTIADEQQSEDLRTVTYTVTLPANERVVFLVLDALAADGDRLARPFALNLTTGGSAGGLTFGGDLTSSDGGSVEGALVALVTGDIGTGAIEFVGIDVIEGDRASEPFQFPAPFGFYTVGAVRLPFPDPEALAYGFYDPNDDGVPDILLSQSGNDVTLAPPAPITASEPMEDAQDAAEAEIPGSQLTGIAPSLVDDQGRGRAWRYRFEGDTGVVEVISVGLFSLPIPSIDDQLGFEVFPVPFRDSDVALAEAESRGGATFRAEQEGMGRTVTVFMGADPVVAQDAAWSVEYQSREATEADPVAAERFRVPLLVSTAQEPSLETSKRFRVLTNPARESLRLGIEVDAPTQAIITVVDSRGRTIERVHEGALRSGASRLEITLPSLPAGVYFARMRTEAGVQTRPFTVVR
ncbi:MAG: T9SS type A sorting domain-containing protein [Bacteroidota bacterium]